MNVINKNKSIEVTLMRSSGPRSEVTGGVDFEKDGTLLDDMLQKGLSRSRGSFFDDQAMGALTEKSSVSEDNDDLFLTNEYRILCYISTIDNWDPEKKYKAHGIRNTRIQGYNKPLEFYSPSYYEITKSNNFNRRTLYWNPKVETDENGEATLKCYNADSSSFLTISIEALHEGEPVALTKHSRAD